MALLCVPPTALGQRLLPLRTRRCLVLLASAALGACAVGPDYHRPDVATPPAYKAAPEGWSVATPDAAGALQSRWWRLYGDSQLDALIERALAANQSIAAYAAAYRAARASVASSRADLFPSVSASGSGTRSGYGHTGQRTGTTSSVNGQSTSLQLDASWEADLWGKVSRSVEASRASAEASDAELAGTRLSVVATLVIDYFALRQADADLALLQAQREVDAQLLALASARYQEGVDSYDDVRTAHNTLQAIDEQLGSARISREQYEHALAALVGQPPAGFSIAARNDYPFETPSIPAQLPATLLQRRPDVVQAERTAAAANASIGVARAAYFPSLTLSADGGFTGTDLAHLVSLPARFWSLGLSAAQTVFDAGATRAAVQKAQAQYDQDVALYRGTVLSAFQDVEDQLSSLRVLREQSAAAGDVAARSQALANSKHDQFQAGTASRIDELDTALTAAQDRKTWLDYQAQALQASVSLIKALGGGWDGALRDGSEADAGAAAGAPAPASAS